MNKLNWKLFLYFIIFTELVGAISGWITRDGMKALSDMPRSALTPPDIVFPIVWGILYALMGIGIARVWQARPSFEKRLGIIVFFVQLAANFLWSIVYFNFQAFAFAFFWLLFLWVLIIIMIYFFVKTDKLAGWIQIPYLLWVTFAAYLNFVSWMFNS